MDLTDILKVTGSIVFSIGAIGGLLIALSKYIGKILADQYIEKIKKDFEKEVTEHKIQLELLSNKASKLHNTRFEKIELLFKKVITLDEKMKAMTSRLKLVTLDAKINEKAENDKMDEAGKSFNDFHDYYRENRFFFTEASCIVIDKLHNEFSTSLNDHIFGKRYEDRQLVADASKKVFQEIPEVLKQLEKELRAIIEVE